MTGVQIDPKAWYHELDVRDAFGLAASVMARGRKVEGLRFTQRGNARFYLGRWLLDWLGAEADKLEPDQCA